MRDNKNDALNDLDEWQKHQFDPGYFTGGKISPLLKYGKSNRKFGWLNIMTAFMAVVLGFALFTIDMGAVRYLIGTFALLLGLLQLMYGIKALRRRSHR